MAPKIAYSEKFEPWNWVITTGNYVDDMRSQVKDTSQAMNIVIRNIAIELIVGIIAVSYTHLCEPPERKSEIFEILEPGKKLL